VSAHNGQTINYTVGALGIGTQAGTGSSASSGTFSMTAMYGNAGTAGASHEVNGVGGTASGGNVVNTTGGVPTGVTGLNSVVAGAGGGNSAFVLVHQVVQVTPGKSILTGHNNEHKFSNITSQERYSGSSTSSIMRVKVFVCTFTMTTCSTM